MTKTPEISFAQTKQERSKKTLEDLIQTAHDLVEGGDPELFTSRTLSKKAGYSLGTLNKRLTSVDKIFLWAIKKGQQKHLAEMSKIIENFDSTQPLHTLLETLVDAAFSKIKKVGPKVMRFYDDRIKKFSSNNDQHHFPDVLVEPFLKAIKRDQTQTFRNTTEDELKLILRTTAIFIERPFIESEHFAGSNEHRKMAVDNLMRLLSKKDSIGA